MVREKPNPQATEYLPSCLGAKSNEGGKGGAKPAPGAAYLAVNRSLLLGIVARPLDFYLLEHVFNAVQVIGG